MNPVVEAIRKKYPGTYDDLSDDQLTLAIGKKAGGAYDDIKGFAEDFKRVSPYVAKMEDVGISGGEFENVQQVDLPPFGQPGTFTRGLSTALSRTVSGATSPSGVAIGAAMMVPGVGPAIGLGMSGYALYEAGKKAKEAIETGSPEAAGEAAGLGLAGNVGMVFGLKGLAGPKVKPGLPPRPPRPSPLPKAAAEAAKEFKPSFTVGLPEEPAPTAQAAPEPKTLPAGEPPKPEPARAPATRSTLASRILQKAGLDSATADRFSGWFSSKSKPGSLEDFRNDVLGQFRESGLQFPNEISLYRTDPSYYEAMGFNAEQVAEHVRNAEIANRQAISEVQAANARILEQLESGKAAPKPSAPAPSRAPGTTTAMPEPGELTPDEAQSLFLEKADQEANAMLEQAEPDKPTALAPAAKPEAKPAAALDWNKDSEIRKTPEGYYEQVENGKVVNTDRDFDSLMRTWSEANAGYSTRIVETKPGHFELSLKDPGESEAVHELVPYSAGEKPKPALPAPAAPKPTPAAPANVAIKQPWQMTFKEYEDQLPDQQKGAVNRALNRSNHKEFVQQALGKGEIVPDEVLRDYPALTRMMIGKAPPAKVEAGGAVSAKLESIKQKLADAEKRGKTDTESYRKLTQQFVKLSGEQARVETGQSVKAAAKVEEQVKTVAKTEGQRPAKEVKSELVDRLERAIDVAPTESEVGPKSSTAVHGKTTVTPDSASKITIDIPGDGVFTIRNTKEALGEVLKRAKKIATTSTEPKPRIPKGAVQSSEKALGEMAKAKEVEAAKNVKINQEKARASLYDAVNKSDTEGIVGRSHPQEDPEIDDGTLWREWRIRKATPEERTEHWKGTKAEIRWVGERRVVKFSKEKGRTENEWLFDDSGKTRADVIRGMEANMPQDAVLQDEGLRQWRNLEKMEGGYAFLREGKSATAPETGPGMVGLGGATKGEIRPGPQPYNPSSQALGITIPGMARLGNSLASALSEIRDIPKFTPFKETVNKWFGQVQKTSLEVRKMMKDIEKAVPKEVRREAITNWLQADGDLALLDTWAKGSKDRKRRKAYEAAKNLTPEELNVARSIRQIYDAYLAKAKANDLVQQGIEDYVTQVWKRPALGGAQFAQFASKLAASFRFGKQRTFENFFAGEQAGYQPVTKDISRLLGLYVGEMGKTIATRDFIKDLVSKKADDGRLLAAPAGSGSVVMDKNAQPTLFVRQFGQPENMRNYSRWTHPALQGWKWVTKDPVSGADVLFKGDLQLHPDIAPHVKNILSRSEIKKWYESPSTALGVIPKNLVRAVDQWGGITKQVMLGFFAPFHHVQEATHAIGHRVNPLFNLPKLDSADLAIQRAMNHGLALAGDNAAMENFREGIGAHRIFEKIPILGTWANAWSDFLFHEYIPRLKLKTYNDILERNKKRYRNTVSLDDVEYLSAQQANAAFGHLNYADIGRNPTIQHLARTFMLAPDFLEARTRFAGQAIKGLVGMQGREQLLALATLAGIFYVGARILNKLGDGDYHWDEPFGFVHNGRIYTMRSVPEDAWRAFKDSRVFIYNRLSPIVGRGTIELLTGKNYRGEKTTPTETFRDLLVSWMPLTLRSLPGVEKLSPSQQNRAVGHLESFMGAMGLQISRFSPINKTYQRARDYMLAHGEKEDRGTYPVSKYQQLRYALEDADIERASLEIKRLQSVEKLTSGKIHAGFHESLFHPWTKSKQMDAQFRASLSHDDRLLFDEAEQQQRRVWTRFNQALAQARKQ